MEIITGSLKATGYEEISLGSLSVIDYPCLDAVLEDILEKYEKNKIAVSLPSLRPELFSDKRARLLSKVKRTGLTFAPEGGSDRIRRIVGKHITEENIISTLEVAYNASWKAVKLYFMYGLPTERDEDIESIVKLVRKIKKKFKGLKINITFSPFVPKPHTPFQWTGFFSKEELLRKKSYLYKEVWGEVKSHSVEASFLEAVLSRGDRKLSKIIELAWKKGAKFDQWGEYLKFSIWEESFREAGIDPAFYTRQRLKEEILPWDHLVFRHKKEDLWSEYQKAVGSG